MALPKRGETQAIWFSHADFQDPTLDKPNRTFQTLASRIADLENKLAVVAAPQAALVSQVVAPGASYGFYTVPIVAGVATPDFAQSENNYILLTVDTTIAAALNPATGKRLHLMIWQDGTGGHKLTWNASYKGGTNFKNLALDKNTYSTIDFLVYPDGFLWLDRVSLSRVPNS